jgi:hypothetical protein
VNWFEQAEAEPCAACGLLRPCPAMRRVARTRVTYAEAERFIRETKQPDQSARGLIGRANVVSPKNLLLSVADTPVPGPRDGPVREVRSPLSRTSRGLTESLNPSGIGNPLVKARPGSGSSEVFPTTHPDREGDADDLAPKRTQNPFLQLREGLCLKPSPKRVEK